MAIAWFAASVRPVTSAWSRFDRGISVRWNVIGTTRPRCRSRSARCGTAGRPGAASACSSSDPSRPVIVAASRVGRPGGMNDAMFSAACDEDGGEHAAGT